MIGKTISHYRIIDKLGEGGMGVVYRAQDLSLDRTVALKVISSDAHPTEEDKIRFSHEAKAAASFSHSHVATIYEFGEGKDGASGRKISFIAMEFIDGQTLSRKIAERPLTLSEAIEIAIDVSDALAKAHDRHIVHRDIKSDNIMLASDGTVKVLDFGLAAIGGRTKVTKAGTTVGTVAYMSPEQARAESVDSRSDLWSLGVVLYEMLAGRKPFAATYEQALVYQILNEEPEPITSLRSNVPMELERIVRKLLQKSPSSRYQSAAEVMVDLRAVSGSDVPSSLDRATSPPDPRRRIFVMAGAAVLFIGTLVGYFFLHHASASTIRSIAVLPFENLSKDPEQEYFADEMTDQLITELSKVHSIRVISRKSCMVFKNKHELLPVIAKTLNVEGLITATVLRSGDRIRINAQLVRGSDEENLWSETFDQRLEGVLDLQATLARSITQRINVALTPDEQLRLSKVRKVNPEVFDLVARGNYFLNSATDAEGFGKVYELMKRAVGLDSTYADAQVGLALSVVQRKLMGVEVAPDIITEAKQAVRKALDLNPSSARAYGALGNLSYIEAKLPECFKAWEKAFEMDSSDGFIVSTYSWILMIKGMYDEGVRLGEKAVELDPLAQYVRCNLMGWYYTTHRFKEAEAQASKILEIDSTWEPALNNLAMICEHEGRYEEARRWWLKDLQRLGIDTKPVPRSGSWQVFRSWRTRTYESAGYLDASVFSLLFEGEKERAIATLKKCVERNSWIAMVLFYPDFDPLRDDPRFAEIIAKAQLPVAAYCQRPGNM